MINNIIYYVNSYFPEFKSEAYDDNFIKACLVYQYLNIKYFSRKLDMEQIKYILMEGRYFCRSNSPIIANHLIFTLAFKAFWKRYKIGRGYVYAIKTSFKESKTLGHLTGIIYWFFRKVLDFGEPTIPFFNPPIA